MLLSYLTNTIMGPTDLQSHHLLVWRMYHGPTQHLMLCPRHMAAHGQLSIVCCVVQAGQRPARSPCLHSSAQGPCTCPSRSLLQL